MSSDTSSIYCPSPNSVASSSPGSDFSATSSFSDSLPPSPTPGKYSYPALTLSALAATPLDGYPVPRLRNPFAEDNLRNVKAVIDNDVTGTTVLAEYIRALDFQNTVGRPWYGKKTNCSI